MTFKSIETLLQEGREDNAPVAWQGEQRIDWGEFRRKVDSLKRPDDGARRRVLVADNDPLVFLARLLAVLADNDVAVVPPNFQPDTLAAFSRMEPPAGLASRTVELYTSGSSGEPKCVRKRLAELDAECGVHEACWGGEANGATVVATTPHHHIYGLLFRLLWPLCAGRPFDTTTISDPGGLAARLGLLENVVLISSPAQLSRLPELMDLAGMQRKPRLLFSSGGPLALRTAEQFEQAWGKAPIEIFGSTESGGIGWRRQTSEARWTPLPGISVSSDYDGALLLRSPFLSQDTNLRMEDLVETHTDGRFVLHGRLDRIVKIEEKRLSLPEMETWLARHADVRECAIAPVRVGTRTIIGAAVVMHPDTEPGRRERIASLKAHLRQRFDDVLLPRRWRFVEQLPYNERGKLSVEILATLLNTAP